MQSTSKKKTINYQEENKYNLPFYSKDDKDRRVIQRLLINYPNPKLTGLHDGKFTYKYQFIIEYNIKINLKKLWIE